MKRAALLAVVSITLTMAGCAARGAPSFVMFGAYFPAWMLFALIGVQVGAIARVVMVTTGLAQTLPFQLAICTSVGVTAGILAWLIWFAA